MSTTAAEPVRAEPSGAEPPEVSVLIHVTDGTARVQALVRAYAQVFADLGRRGELVFVLDGVAGKILDELERLQDTRDDVRVFALQGGGHGESIAFKAALDHARGSILVTAWDYLQIDPRELGNLLEVFETEGPDLVSAWRHPRVDPFLNRVQSAFFNWFLRRMSRVDLHDLNCNFRMMRREVLEEITLYGDLFRFLPIMAARRGFKVREVKVRHLEERGRTGFFGLGVYMRRLLDILAVTFLTRFTRKPLRFFGIIGMVLVLAGLFFALPPFIERVVGSASIQDRPIVLVGVVLISFGLQFIGFGLVGEIIIFTQSKNLKDYKVERVLSSASGVISTAPSEPRPKLAPRELFVRRPAPGEDVLLDRFVEEHPQGTPFDLSAWRLMVVDVRKREPEVLLAERDGKVVGVLPWFNVKSWFLGKVAISCPFAVYGGCLAQDVEAARALIDRACSESDARGNAYLELRHIEGYAESDLGRPMATTDRYITFVRDLPEDPADCLGMIPRKARAECRKVRDSGLEFVEHVDLETFGRLFASNKQELGSPAIPNAMLASIFARLLDHAVMHQVRTKDGTCVATVLSFLFQNRIYPYYSGTAPGHGGPGVSNFMYWKLMEWASAQGLRSFDFGRSRRDSGPARFKKHMGFEAKDLHYQYHLGAGGKVPDFTPDNPKLGVYKKLWGAVPGPVARRLGSRIFKHLP